MGSAMNLGEAVVLSDLLPAHKAAHIRDVLLSDRFPWYWNERTLEEVPKAAYQFTHLFWTQGQANSDLSYMPIDILHAVEELLNIKTKDFLRAKANLLCTLGDVDVDQQQEIHRDVLVGDNVYSIVYYVGESDGDTVTYRDGVETTRAQHKDNTAFVFNSLTQHRGSLPRKHKRRVVVNIIFQAE
jgi:hypothetical protein